MTSGYISASLHVPAFTKRGSAKDTPQSIKDSIPILGFPKWSRTERTQP